MLHSLLTSSLTCHEKYSSPCVAAVYFPHFSPYLLSPSTCIIHSSLAQRGGTSSSCSSFRPESPLPLEPADSSQCSRQVRGMETRWHLDPPSCFACPERASPAAGGRLGVRVRGTGREERARGSVEQMSLFEPVHTRLIYGVSGMLLVLSNGLNDMKPQV